MHWGSHILRYAIRSEVLIKYVHKNFKRILLLPLLIEHGVVFNLLKSLFLLQLFSFEAALLALYQLKVENSFSIIRCVSGCSLHSIMFVIWAWLPRLSASDASVPLLPGAQCPGYCSLPVSWHPRPPPSRPLLSGRHRLHSRTIVIISSASYLHQHAWLGCKYFETVCSILILIQSHYSRQAVLSITRWETGWNMESDIQDHNSGDVVIIPDELSSCDRSLSGNSLQISLQHVWPASRRLWGTIAHLPRWSRSLLNKTFPQNCSR